MYNAVCFFLNLQDSASFGWGKTNSQELMLSFCQIELQFSGTAYALWDPGKCSWLWAPVRQPVSTGPMMISATMYITFRYSHANIFTYIYITLGQTNIDVENPLLD